MYIAFIACKLASVWTQTVEPQVENSELAKQEVSPHIHTTYI